MKRNALLISSLALMAVLGTSLSASAHGNGNDGAKGGQRGGMMFDVETLDTDGDGKISMEEIEARHLATFAEADTNGDGGLDADELKAAAEARLAERDAKMQERKAARFDKMIEKLDANEDGVLSAEEMTPKGDRLSTMFEKLDADEDGLLSEEELEAAKGKMAPRGGKGGKGGHRGDGHGKGPKSDR